ncbi:MAG: N-acetylglucosamine-6-phosphate deacetylase, partial [Anaerolineales bacterium]|nr:N-acetylglucosamine-6-phosphate deacetylase [Anaerolineales bacterium]
MSLTIEHVHLPVPAGPPRTISLQIQQGRIRQLGLPGKRPALGRTLDGHGLFLLPGFIDLQVNGGFGRDFTADPATIWAVAAQLPRYGVTRFLPTIITAPLGTMAAALAVMKAGPPAGFRGSVPLGLHLEGPFLSPQKPGAHPPQHLLAPDASRVTDWAAPEVRLVTLAPELPGAGALIEALAARGIVVSMGHSAATYEEALAALDAGVRYGTHLFNAMAPLHHRAPGLAAALLSDTRATLGLIADLVHVHPALVRLVWQLAGPARLTLVTDAMAALGMGDGRYQLGDQIVTVADGSARLADGTLAGAILPLNLCLRNL